MSKSFCDKYKPSQLNDIIGNVEQINELTNWLNKFTIQKNKCMVVIGAHGSGKNCIIDIVLNKLGYTHKQLNITRFKQATDKYKYFKELTTSNNLLTKCFDIDKLKYAIVIDEYDIEILVQEKALMIKLMQLNNQYCFCPIIFMFNTKHNKLISTLCKGASKIYLDEPSNDMLMMLLKRICISEGIKIQTRTIADNIISLAQNDFRKLCTILDDIINELKHGTITLNYFKKYIDIIQKKDIADNLFDATTNLLTNYENVNNCLELYNLEKVNIPLMIHQYFPLLFLNTKNKKMYLDLIKRITRSLSFGDVVDNYVYGEQRWDITNVHGFYSCCLPSFTAKQFKQQIRQPLKFPIDLNKTSNKRLNKKNIIQSSKAFSNDPIDFIFINKIISDLITKQDTNELIIFMKQHNLTLRQLETIVKIDKNMPKITFTTKQKKIMQEFELSKK